MAVKGTVDRDQARTASRNVISEIYRGQCVDLIQKGNNIIKNCQHT